MMNEAWKDLVDWYIIRCRYWHGLLGTFRNIEDLRKNTEILDMAYGLWGHVWHEHDLVLAFAHRLMKYIESEELDIHVHVLYKLKPENFRVFKDFSRSIYEAIKRTRTVLGLGRRWYPEIDIVNDLRRKVVMLRTLKEQKVCIDAGVLLLDDVLCRRDRVRCDEVVRLLEEAGNELLVLSHHVTYDELLSKLPIGFFETHANTQR